MLYKLQYILAVLYGMETRRANNRNYSGRQTRDMKFSRAFCVRQGDKARNSEIKMNLNAWGMQDGTGMWKELRRKVTYNNNEGRVGRRIKVKRMAGNKMERWIWKKIQQAENRGGGMLEA